MTDPTKLTELTVATSSAALVAIAFTPSEITAITIAVGALVATIFTGIVNIITALRTERKVDRTAEKVGETLEEAKVIKGHVNSAASTAATKIDMMQQQIDQLTQMLSENKQTAAVLAQSQSGHVNSAASAAARALAENTELTKEIRDVVVNPPKEP